MIGMHFNDPLPNPPKTDWVRLWDCGVTWKDIHIGPNQYDFSRLDYLVDLYSDRNILYVVAATPRWLAINPDAPHFAPWLGKGSNSLPYDLKQWDQFISLLSKRYNGRIQAYEIWNEPQLSDFMYPYSLSNRNRLATMTKRAYSIIKKNSSKSLVLSASVLPRMSSGGMRRGNKYLNALKRKGWPVDHITCHIYPEVGFGPKMWSIYLENVKSSVKRLGGPNGVWVTETNYNLLGDVIDDKKAWNYVKNTYAYAGNSPVFWYTWDKVDEIGGLNINIGTPAFSSMIKHNAE